MGDQNTSYFNARKFEGASSNLGMVDASDLMANKGYTISFLHVPSGRAVFFKAFLTAFNETYNSNWNKEEVFGRMDPIVGFKNTTRKISLAFKVPASTHSEAFDNLGRVQSLVQFLYPVYTDVQNALTISESPLLRLKIMNLAADQSSQTAGTYDDFKAIGSFTGNNSLRGLLGYPSNLTVNHNIQNFDTSIMELGPSGDSGNTPNILPKMIEINMDFTVIHEHHLGWGQGQDGEGKVFGKESFPYGIDYRPGVATEAGIKTEDGPYSRDYTPAGPATVEVPGPTQGGEPLREYNVGEFNFGTSWSDIIESTAGASPDNLPDPGTELTPSEAPSGDSASDSATGDNEAALIAQNFGLS